MAVNLGTRVIWSVMSWRRSRGGYMVQAEEAVTRSEAEAEDLARRFRLVDPETEFWLQRRINLAK